MVGLQLSILGVLVLLAQGVPGTQINLGVHAAAACVSVDLSEVKVSEDWAAAVVFSEPRLMV